MDRFFGYIKHHIRCYDRILPDSDKQICDYIAGKQLNDTCCICLQGVDKKNPVSVLYCGHIFHSECIYEWLSINSTCPCCRTDISVQTKDTTRKPSYIYTTNLIYLNKEK